MCYRNDIFIGDSFPEPLNQQELFAYIKQAREGNLEAREKVIIHNARLVLKQVLTAFANTPYEQEELFEIGMVGLIKAVDNFDITRGSKFSSCALKYINNEILNFIKKSNKNLKGESFNKSTISDKDGVELNLEDKIADEFSDFITDLEKRELILEIRKQVEMLEAREKEIIKLYFGFYDGRRYTEEEIGMTFGITRQWVSEIIKQTLTEISQKLLYQGLIVQKDIHEKYKIKSY